MACIGCNDCLLACPITQSKSVTIGELNAAIFLPTIDHRHVVDFVTACTQCKQLRPGLPVGSEPRRDGPVNKLKVENSVADFQLSLQVLARHRACAASTSRSDAARPARWRPRTARGRQASSAKPLERSPRRNVGGAGLQ